jgi:uncharacterized protein with PIN domain
VGKTLRSRIERADDRLLSQVYDTASRLLLARRHDLEARLALDRLMLRLGLSQDEAARMLGVSGERALDWILRGRIAEVAGRYEIALAYQG